MAPLRLDSQTLVPTDDEAGGQARTWRICSQSRVNVRSEPSHEAGRSQYVEAGEEFEATGPFRVQRANLKKMSKQEWLQLTNGAGFVCTTSSKDPGKLVAALKRKRSAAHLKEPDTALIIKPEWCDQIFDHGKVWEIRGEPCNKRGRFAIAASGSGTLIGEATLVDCLRVGRFDADGLGPWRNKKRYKRMFLGKKENMSKHRIKDLSIVTYPKVFAWVLDDAVRYKTPVPYTHPQGAIKWVKLSENGQAAVELAEDTEEGGNSEASSSADSDSQSSGEEPNTPDKCASPKGKAPEVAPAVTVESDSLAAPALLLPQVGTGLMERLQWATSTLTSGLPEHDAVALLQSLLEATGDLGPDPAKAAAALKESNAGKVVFQFGKSAAAPRVAELANLVIKRWWSQAKPR